MPDMTYRPPRFGLLLILFLLTGFSGLWLACSPTAAWPKLISLTAGLALYAIIAALPERIWLDRGSLHPLRLLFGVSPAALALIFLVAGDWTRLAARLPLPVALLDQLAQRQPLLPEELLHPNAVGGALAALLPLQWAAFRNAVRSSRPIGWLYLPLVALTAAGLLASGSRGAWLALAAVLAAWLLWGGCMWLAGRTAGTRRPLRSALCLATLAGAGMTAGWFLLASPLGVTLAGLRPDRLAVWHNSLVLAQDYPLSGLGLGNFAMAYASYAFLSHVPYLYHAHNLYLDIWLEQGFMGLVLWIGLVAEAARALSFAGLRAATRVSLGSEGGKGRLVPAAGFWPQAAAAALATILLHGLVDDPLYGYHAWIAGLLFLPFGLLARTGQPTEAGAAASPQSGLPWRLLKPALGGILVIVLLGGLLLPRNQSRLWANWGTLRQNQVELCVYHWPEWPIQDAMRRVRVQELAPALAAYARALALDPDNITAHRRLGQIELSLGAYEDARTHLEAAYRVAPGHTVSRLLLGESYAVTGEVERAASVWRGVDLGAGRLAARQWWYNHIGESERSTWLAEAAALR